MKKVIRSSIKSLSRDLQVTDEIAGHIKRICFMIPEEIKPRIREVWEAGGLPMYPLNICPKTLAWVRSCHNPPLVRDVKLACLDELMEGYGVERIESKASKEVYHGNIEDRGDGLSFDYVNMGDTYICTVVYFKRAFRVTSWGDIVERNSGKYE
jgi:hypothetical protein